MTTRKRLLIFIIVSFAITAAMGIVLNIAINKKVKNLLKTQLVASREDSYGLLTLNDSKLKSYSIENTYWDEMVTAVAKKDSLFFTNIIKNALVNFDASSFWVYDAQMNEVYRASVNNSGITLPLQVINTTFKDSLFKNHFLEYTIKQGKTTLKIFTAPVHPSMDVNRVTPPRGYFICARIIDTNYLAGLAKIGSGAKFSFSDQEVTTLSSIDMDNATTTEYFPLQGFDNDHHPVIVKTKIFSEVKAYQQYTTTYSLIFDVLILFLLLISVFIFRKHLFVPLENIAKSLKSKSGNAIASLKNQPNEFGEIAALIDGSFKKEAQLEQEISVRRESEEALKIAVDKIESSTIEKVKAEQSATAKSEFLSIMSHEIRTPINGVIGVANLLNEEILTTRQREYVDILNFSSKHLLSLVTDILDFSKIETGKIEFDKHSFNLNQVCQSGYQLFKVNADEKHVQLNFLPDLNLQQSIYGDDHRLSQIITNLLSNAIKFTEKGQIDFCYKIITETNSHATIEFVVKDTGIGIKQEDTLKIFESFSQADKNISAKFGGSGLGLTICKQLVELQGGKIEVASEFGKGSVFTFYLSFDKYPFTGLAPENKLQQINKPQDLHGMKVLIAEDNNINILVLRRFLEKWGVHFKIGYNGKEAVEMAGKENFDMILMDLHMPEMNGEDAAKIIRNNIDKKINSIPIVALTANASVDMQQKLLSNGFDNYLSKPFSPDILFKILKKYYHEN